MPDGFRIPTSTNYLLGAFTCQGTFQAAGANGGATAIVTAISLGASNGCRFIVTH